MKPDQLAQLARKGEPTSLRLDHVIVETVGKQFEMNGSFRIEGERFILDLIQRSGEELPQSGGFVGASQFWEITGVIENSLRFRCRGIPSSHTTSMGPVSTTGARFKVDRLELESDTSIHEHTEAVIADLQTEQPQRDLEDEPIGLQPPSETASDVGYEFCSRIPGVKPVFTTDFTTTVKTNAYLAPQELYRRDTFRGQTNEVEFALIEDREDTVIHMRYRAGKTASEAGARARFTALLQAVSFTHGWECWPQRFLVERGVQVVEDVINARRSVPSTSYTLLSETACANGADLANAIILAMNFFATDNHTSRQVRTLLRIARQAGAPGVGLDLGTVGLCTVFEGVVRALYKEANLEDHLIEQSAELQSFEQARKEVLAELNSEARASDDAFNRLQHIIRSAEAVRTREKVRALAQHLQVDWDRIVRPGFDAWSNERNPVAHGSYAEQKDEALIATRVFNMSRIAGLINLLIAKRIGYSGLAVRSRLEDDYVRL